MSEFFCPIEERVTTTELPERLLSGLAGGVLVKGHGALEILGEPRHGRLLMAHGAGAGQDSAFLKRVRVALANKGVQTLAIEFDYMRQMRREARRRPPPRIDRLVDELSRWCDLVTHNDLSAPWLGGKSMGARAASLLAARDQAAGLVLLGYPFHPSAKPDALRLSHWPLLACPTLVVQGSRDPFGSREELASYDLWGASVHILEDGDHDWKPRRASGRRQDELIDEGAAVVAAFMSEAKTR
ncbi:alpha/beta family hydrolase [Halomonas urumqiensis]|uniref:alpha/beta family hydrolase n=1 Tax=Halomonas urumqiensis TaxID=1684789 RepID=UPI00199DB8E6|nr:alpha/beta family hydrolase [Halomonas urumqiensis]GHE20753.1 alpha/beta hydrolase [Halomonas urumqiensis]